MSMTATLPGIESLTLIVTQEIHVKASLETAFEALLEQIGPENESPEQKMPMILEAWPGGRWYRDLGDDNGHSGDMCSPSSVRSCWRSAVRCSCRTRSRTTCSTG